MAVDRKDVASGAFFVAVGLFYGFTAWKNLPIGITLNMGPGYFPLALSTILVLLGLGVVVRGIWMGPGMPFGVVPWCAIFYLTVALLFSAIFFRRAGLFPSIFITAFLASLASAQIRPHSAAVVSLILAAFCVLVF